MALDRMREQRAMKLLDALQDDLRAQMRLEKDELGRNGENRRASVRRKARIARLSDPHERERIWSHEQFPSVWQFAAFRRRLDLVARIQDWVHEPEIRARLEEQRLLELQQDAVLASGRVFAFGANSNGELGLGHRRACEVPTEIESFRGAHVTHVYSGFDANFAFARSKDGQVFAWGGAGHAIFDELFTFGCGDGGRLGLGGNEDSFHPQLVSALEKCVVLDACCGSWHTLCIARERDETFPVRAPRRVLEATSTCSDSTGGFVYSFGSGLQGQLGLGKQMLAALPTCIPTLRYRHVRCRSIATSSHHSCALAVDGNLYTWGQNTSGSLGRKGSDVGATDLPEPGVVDRGSFRNYGVGPIVSIAAGHGFTLFAAGPWEPREEPSKMQFQLQTTVNRNTKQQQVQRSQEFFRMQLKQQKSL
ncbi:hypothetical protein PF010_g3685 [Phytophthora fragariae]|uniref:Uncharacterized protein n=1 Tax=Phytophthora fragariae TaxID=53985 RepID=A0A6A4EQJ8_9STRA|nr:hypothetical protein PF010_g3685 [Phytophthora fragariae]KAE9326045.1 hypothetical protein PF001_g2618 [Phytophthora fragariae]